MIDYIVAGSSDCQETAELENHCNVVTSTFQNLKVKMIIKHPKEWPKYLTEICKIYGFKEKLNPICFTPEGILIGNAKNFKEMLEKKYSLSELPHCNLHPIAKETNVSLVNEDYEFRNRCKCLKEKVNDSFTNHEINGDFTFNKEPFRRVVHGAHYNFLKITGFAKPHITVKQEKKVDTVYLERHDPEWDISTAILLDKHPDEPENEDPKKDAKKEKIHKISETFVEVPGTALKPSGSTNEMIKKDDGSKEILEVENLEKK